MPESFNYNLIVENKQSYINEAVKIYLPSVRAKIDEAFVELDIQIYIAHLMIDG